MTTKTTKQKQSQREDDREAMLKEALSRPGVREVMRIYQNWKQKDCGLNAYRIATKPHQRVIVTDHTNMQESFEA